MFDVIGLAKSITDIAGRFIPDPVALAKVQQEVESQLIQASAQVMAADAAQDDKFTKRARPMLVYWSLGYVTIITFLAPFGYAGIIIDALRQVPSDLWTLMTVGVGAFGVGRSIEKGVAAFKK